MKRKVLLSLLVLVGLFVFAGCEKKNESQNSAVEPNNNNQEAKEEEKKLICDITEKDDETTEIVKFTWNFKGDKFDKVILSSDRRYSGSSYDEDDATEATDTCNKDLKNKGVSCNVSKSGNRLVTTYTFTVADLDEEGKKIYEKFDLNDFDGKSYDDIKTTMTTATYTCK